MKPRLLDLFCGAGGAAMGYHRAGFEVVGVDIKPQPRYPFEFHQAEALEFLGLFDDPGSDYYGWVQASYDAIHASPPCQAYSPLRALSPNRSYPDLIAATRERLMATGLPWVIENVISAPLRHGVVLCGGMFGLRTYRHRRFESSVLMFQPEHPPHVVRTSTKKRSRDWEAGLHVSVTGDVGTYVGQQAMGIEWMTGAELSEAIPPAYTEWIGRQLIAVITPETTRHSTEWPDASGAAALHQVRSRAEATG